ncbi:MAG: SUMF1/EgtB/PvdO family nonheme iron enzyme [Chloroflexi bacterium]|nr:SUMF1/EgtB/PvdO family nonheme iron enzyme [Chloroflexota bacterium]
MKTHWRLLILATVLLVLALTSRWWFLTVLAFVRVNSDVIQAIEALLQIVLVAASLFTGWLALRRNPPATHPDDPAAGQGGVGGNKTTLNIQGENKAPVIVGDGNQTIVNYPVIPQGPGISPAKGEDYDELIKKYLTWLINSYNHVRLFGFERLGVNDQRPDRPLREIFIPISFYRIAVPGTHEDENRLATGSSNEGMEREKPFPALREEREKAAGNIPLSNLLKKSPQLLIIGSPGCGKSTLLKYLAVCEATHVLTGQALPFSLPYKFSDPVPLYVSLRGYEKYQAQDREHPGNLVGYILHYLNHYGEFLPDFSEECLEWLLTEGRSMILLDGLDEVVDSKVRGRVRARIEALAENYKNNIFIITAREAGFQDSSVFNDHFTRLDIRPLDGVQIGQLVANWCRQIYPIDTEARILEIGTAIEEINTWHKDKKLPPLISTPLMVTMVLGVKWGHTKLPRERAKLYDAIVNVTLNLQYTQDDADRDGLVEVGGTVDDQLEWLWTLAFSMHSGGQPTTVVSKEYIHQVLFERFPGDMTEAIFDRFIGAVENRGGLLEAQAGLYQFTHLTFQEFLSARYIVDCQLKNEQLRPYITDPWWREVLLLTYGYAIFNSRQFARGYLAWLSDLQGDDRLAGLELAATALLESGVREGEIHRAHAQNIIGELANPKKAYPAPLRARAGRALAHLGDARFRPDAWFLPDEPLLGFVKIPAGPFLMSSDPRREPQAELDEQHQHSVNLEEFYISRYPVTVAQYRAFVETSGFSIGDSSGLSGLDNAPVVCINLDEALAYGKWLTGTLRESTLTPSELREALEYHGEITLPSEAEWEKAAKSRPPADGNLPDAQMVSSIYPWGDTFDTGRANTRESGIGGTTVVGIFPAGASGYGILDLSGNVYEWTRSMHEKYPYDPNDGRENLGGKKERILRGGSWNERHFHTRCSYRNWLKPQSRSDFIGFRTVLVPYRYKTS